MEARTHLSERDDRNQPSEVVGDLVAIVGQACAFSVSLPRDPDDFPHRIHVGQVESIDIGPEFGPHSEMHMKMGHGVRRRWNHHRTCDLRRYGNRLDKSFPHNSQVQPMVNRS